jgi:DNA sulfur modification protein DndE
MISLLRAAFFFSLTLALSAAPSVFMVGDSTMANKPLDLPERGWGQELPRFFKDPAMVKNFAMNGRSTKSFIDEGRWQKVLDQLQPGDFVIIQFGHNDEKEYNPAVYADPQTKFPENLRRYVNESRAKGATPILATSVCRRKFDDHGKLINTHGVYPDVTRAVAEELHVPLLELQAATAKMLEQAGPEASKKYFMWIEKDVYERLPNGAEDDTHFVELGAIKVAALAVAQMQQGGFGPVDALKPLPKSSVEAQAPSGKSKTPEVAPASSSPGK